MCVRHPFEGACYSMAGLAAPDSMSCRILSSTRGSGLNNSWYRDVLSQRALIKSAQCAEQLITNIKIGHLGPGLSDDPAGIIAPNPLWPERLKEALYEDPAAFVADDFSA